jgi:hypothetical protein
MTGAAPVGDRVTVTGFGCDALIEADDPNAVVEAFVAHRQESHTWSYPIEATRNDAPNYAEATEWLTGGTPRLPEIGDIIGGHGMSARYAPRHAITADVFRVK